jgi:hypothetical protein
MVGQYIESRRSFHLAVVFFTVLALALIVLDLVLRNVHVAIGSLCPFLITALVTLTWPRPFRARLTETALEVETPPLIIPYPEMQGLVTPGRPPHPYKTGPRDYPIQVLHGGGELWIPAPLNVRSDDVFSFLLRQFVRRRSGQVNPLLWGYREAMERRYGHQCVWTFRARAVLGGDRREPQLAAFFFGWCLAGVIWMVFGGLTDALGWFLAGLMATILGGVFGMLFLIEGRKMMPRIKKWRQASLVICPEGLALIQGNFPGMLRWDQVRNAKLVGKPAADLLTWEDVIPGIMLEVERGRIFIADLYDCPLSLIYQHIAYYWRGEDLPASPAGAWRPPDKQVPHAEDFDEGIQTS